MDNRNRRWMLAVALVAGGALAVAQNPDPQEVRLAAYPYFPKPAITTRLARSSTGRPDSTVH